MTNNRVTKRGSRDRETEELRAAEGTLGPGGIAVVWSEWRPRAPSSYAHQDRPRGLAAAERRRAASGMRGGGPLKTTPLVSYIYNRPLVSYIYNRPVTVFVFTKGRKSNAALPCRLWAVRPGSGGLRLARGAQHAQFDVADRLGFHTRAHLTGAEARPRETGAAPGGACIQPYRSARSFVTDRNTEPFETPVTAQPSAGCHGRDVARRNRGGTRESCNAQ